MQEPETRGCKYNLQGEEDALGFLVMIVMALALALMMAMLMQVVMECWAVHERGIWCLAVSRAAGRSIAGIDGTVGCLHPRRKAVQLRGDYVKINDTSTDATEFSPCVPECLYCLANDFCNAG